MAIKKKCEWCGRTYEDNDNIFSSYYGFCSKKCKTEYLASKNSGGSNSGSGGGSKSGGCLKWAIIIFIVICALVALFSE